MNSIPKKTPHKLKMMGESKNGRIAISKLPVAWKKPTASNSTMGSYAMICRFSRCAPASEKGEREAYAAMTNMSSASVMTNTHRRKLPPEKKMPPARNVKMSAQTT